MNQIPRRGFFGTVGAALSSLPFMGHVTNAGRDAPASIFPRIDDAYSMDRPRSKDGGYGADLSFRPQTENARYRYISVPVLLPIPFCEEIEGQLTADFEEHTLAFKQGMAFSEFSRQWNAHVASHNLGWAISFTSVTETCRSLSIKCHVGRIVMDSPGNPYRDFERPVRQFPNWVHMGNRWPDVEFSDGCFQSKPVMIRFADTTRQIETGFLRWGTLSNGDRFHIGSSIVSTKEISHWAALCESASPSPA